MPVPDHLWTEHEAARFLGVSNHAVRKWRSMGMLGFIKTGTLVRYDPNEIRAFAERNRTHPTCQTCNLEVKVTEISLPNEIDSTFPRYAAS